MAPDTEMLTSLQFIGPDSAQSSNPVSCLIREKMGTLVFMTVDPMALVYVGFAKVEGIRTLVISKIVIYVIQNCLRG